VTFTREAPLPQSNRADRGLEAVRSRSLPSGSQRSRSDSSRNASYSRSTGTATVFVMKMATRQPPALGAEARPERP
jgi:hypothetical protein